MEQKKNGLKAWTVAIICTLGGIIAASSVMKINPTSTLIMSYFGIGESLESLLLSVCSIVGVIIALPCGWIVDKFGPRVVGIVSLAVTMLGGIMGAFATTYEVMLVARILEGFAFGTWSILGPVLINAWFTPERRGLPMSIFSVWIGWSLLFIFRVSNAVIDRSDPSSWVNVWWLTVIGAAIVLVLFILFVHMPKESKDALANSNSGKERPKINIVEGLKSPGVWLVSGMFFVFSFANQVMTAFTSTYCQNVLGTDIITANNLTSWWTLGNVLGALIVGVIVIKVVRVDLRAIMALIISVLSIFFYATIFSISVDIAPIYLLIAGAVCISMTPVGFNLVPDLAVSPMYIGIAMAVSSLVQRAGNLCVAFGGIAIEFGGGYQGATTLLICLGVVYVILAIATVVVCKKRVKKQATQSVPQK